MCVVVSGCMMVWCMVGVCLLLVIVGCWWRFIAVGCDCVCELLLVVPNSWFVCLLCMWCLFVCLYGWLVGWLVVVVAFGCVMLSVVLGC